MRVGRRAGQGKNRTESAVDVAVHVAPCREEDTQERQPHAAGPHYIVDPVGYEFVLRGIFNGTPVNFAGTASREVQQTQQQNA